MGVIMQILGFQVLFQIWGARKVALLDTSQLVLMRWSRDNTWTDWARM